MTATTRARSTSAVTLALSALLLSGCGGGSSSSSGSGSLVAVAAATSGTVAVATSAAPASPPAATSAAPAALWNDGPAVLVVQGAAFAAPAEVSLVDAAGVAAPLRAVQVVVRSSTELEATFAAGAPAGARQVVVTTAAGASASIGAPSVTLVNNVDPDAAGGHLVGWRDVQLQGASGDRPSMRVYYPATAAAAGAPVDLARGPTRSSPTGTASGRRC
jgi:hypothetical protein